MAYESPGRASLRIDDFRCNPRYAGDGNRIDLAYAVYALSHGAGEDEVRRAIASRDLAKKGPEQRQKQYIDRTLEKARSIMELSTSGGYPRALKQAVER
jgi:hypothetical protein